MRRIVFALVCILPLIIYILYRDYINWKQYTRYTNHMMINLKIRAKLKYIHSFTYQTASTRQLVELTNLTKDGADKFRTEIFDLLREEKKQELTGFSSSLNDYLTFYSQVMDQTLCFEQLTDATDFTLQKCERELVLKRGLQTAIYKFIDLSKNITTTISEMNEVVDMDGDRIRMIGSLG
jgi:hypothetical protein